MHANGSFGYEGILYYDTTLASLILSAVFILTSPARIWWLLSRRQHASPKVLPLTKIAFHSLYVTLQVALAALWSRDQNKNSTYSAAAAGLAAGGGILMLVLSWLENGRSQRPSSSLVAYLLLLALFSVSRTCTIWIVSVERPINALLTLITVIEVILIILESIEISAQNSSKRERPESYSGIANRIVFLWPNRLFLTGARELLEPGHLFALDQEMASVTLNEKFTTEYKKHPRMSSNRSAWTLAIVLWKPMFLAAIPRLAMYLSAIGTGSLPSEGRGLIGAYALQYVGLAVFTGLFWQSHIRFIAMVRGCLVSALNDKIIRADTSYLPNPKASMTLMSTDMQQINLGLMRMHDLWGNTLQAALAAYLLGRQVGIACIYPVILVVCCAVASVSISPLTNKRQRAWMKAVETRVGVTSSLLSSIRGLKMRGLLPIALDRIQGLRKVELENANRFRNTMVYSFVLAYIPQYIGPVVTFLAFILQARARGEVFDAPRAFTSLSTLLILCQPLTSTIQGIPLFVAALGSCGRIDEFIATPDLGDIRQYPKVNPENPWNKSPPAVIDTDLDTGLEMLERVEGLSRDFSDAFHLVDADLGWTKETAVLRSINTKIPRGGFTCIIGPVACGKTAFCRALIGEGVRHQGRVEMFARTTDVAYVDQIPWLINDSIKRNIIGFSDVDSTWYNTVVEACGLRGDLEMMPAQSDTLVGNDGAALSGGQKQRVCLARALYSRKRIIIIDDALSGLDARTAQHVFHHAIGPSGIAAKQGATIVFAVHFTPYLSQARHIIVLGHEGRIVRQGTYESLRESLIEQVYNPDEPNDQSTQHSIPPVGLEQDTTVIQSSTSSAKEDRSKIMNDRSAYLYYFKSAGLFFMILLFSIMAIQTGLSVSATYWLGYWTEIDRPDNMRYWAVYCAMQFVALLLLSVTVYQIIITMVTRSGTTMHRNLIKTVCSTFLPFLSTRDSGKTLNHFSQDIEIMDRDLPFSFADVLIAILTFLGQSILILAIFPWSAFILLGCAPVIYFLQRIYLRTSRQMRLLDLEAKSPLYSTYMSILRGASTIRAYGWTEQNFNHVQSLLDRSQQPAYLLQIVQQWLNFVLEMMVACIAIVVVTIAVTIQSLPSNAGVVMTQVMSIGLWLQYAVKGWTLFETSLGAISRIKQFEEQTPLETRTDVIDAPANWPSKGKVEWRDVTASYGLDANSNALENVSLSVSPGEWIGICGKTGSGKSSLIQTLLQLLEIKQGHIVIDDICLDQVEPDAIRQRINTIPQDPISIPGTVRLNLDPYEQHPDEDLVSALEKVSLSHLLDTELKLSTLFEPGKLSSGQRQLFAIATAILAKSKVVLVDEATSQVDAETEALIQKILRSEFRSSTLFTIAHRLKSLLDHDRILVLDDGKVLEFDTPEVLLSRDSLFRRIFDIAK